MDIHTHTYIFIHIKYCRITFIIKQKIQWQNPALVCLKRAEKFYKVMTHETRSIKPIRVVGDFAWLVID